MESRKLVTKDQNPENSEKSENSELYIYIFKYIFI
jgi:hypothetical protein